MLPAVMVIYLGLNTTRPLVISQAVLRFTMPLVFSCNGRISWERSHTSRFAALVVG
jgi:hypothetical protein